jgi:sugar phosphate isomerase/epimerase
MNIADELSIQLYSLREFGDLERQLAALARAGFKRVEITGGHLEDAEATRALLDSNGMAAPTAHVPMSDLRNRLGWVAEQAKTIGITELFMPYLPPEEQGKSADGWQAIGAELGGMAEELGAHGLTLGYHNHDWELHPYSDGTAPLEHLFAGAVGSPLTFQADLAWIARGGGDPVSWMKALKTRLTSVHVKDIAPEGGNADEDGWSDVGAGVLDWTRLWQEAMRLGAKWMVLEHDKPKDPIGFASRSREYLLHRLG